MAGPVLAWAVQYGRRAGAIAALILSGCDFVLRSEDITVVLNGVVLDLQRPDSSGVEVTRGLRAAHPAARVLVLSASGEQLDVLDAVKAGAVGYLLKSASRPEFLHAVRRTEGQRSPVSDATVEARARVAALAAG